jgi:plastocyanin
MRSKSNVYGRFIPATALLLLAGCGLTGPAHDAPIPEAAAVVDMGFMSFSPATITVKAGQTVEWRNTSIITHNVTDSPGSAASPGDAALPAGALAFSSGDLAGGKIFAYKFTVPGTYHYFCTHHESDGMVGVVVVTPAS